jgi:hypothetical protein
VLPLFVLLVLSSSLVSAQQPVVGDVNYYGIRKVAAAKVESALGVKAGDPLPPSKGDLEDRLEEVPGVIRARVTAVCCDGANAMLFVGVEEKSAPRFALRSEPAGSVTLPEPVEDAFRRFLDAVEAAARRGSTAEDLTAGHSMMADAEPRAIQTQFIPLATKNLAVLRDVLRNGADPEQRAIAASVIAYAPKKAEVVDDLQYALQDPDESVRANAMRSLTALAVLAARQPDSGVKIAPTWLVEMLNSLVLSDRTRAAEALVTITERDRAALAQVRERALAAVVEMARWKSLRYAVPAYVLIGRMAGMTEDQIHKSWEKGERETAIAMVLKPARK